MTLKPFSKLYYLLPVLVVSCLSFNTLEGKHYISRLVVFMFVIAVFVSRNIIKENLNNPEIKKIVSFWFVIAIILSSYHLFRGEYFGIPRSILVSLLYLIIVPWDKLPKPAVLLALLIGGGIAGINSWYEYYILNVSRVGGVINQIPFSLYVAITWLIAIYTLWVSDSKYIKFLAWLAVIGSTFAIIMSEVRGVWLALLCVVVVFLFCQYKKMAVRGLMMTGMLVFAISVMFYAIPDVSQRINETKLEFIELSNGNKDTSIGIRFQLWYSAIDIIKNHSLFGVGTLRYQNIMEQQYQQGLISQAALGFKRAHFHNQYLDSYVRYGIIGVIMVLAIFMSPKFLYANKGVDFRIKNLCFFMSLLCLVAGMTDVPLHHTGIIYVLVIYPAAISLSHSREMLRE